ncbi:hypothetical protein OG194_30510 [Streptomyces sp. NBC_01288]|uniref:hypothetical protein n=1 Tax=Streptomyces sp. NBC_01288 TaxID=2903814 RepID=UPI002E128B8F|nr:hypothetical protein OG194_30510 [Streptomyces sp. NBC_01288]
MDAQIGFLADFLAGPALVGFLFRVGSTFGVVAQSVMSTPYVRASVRVCRMAWAGR